MARRVVGQEFGVGGEGNHQARERSVIVPRLMRGWRRRRRRRTRKEK